MQAAVFLLVVGICVLHGLIQIPGLLIIALHCRRGASLVPCDLQRRSSWVYHLYGPGGGWALFLLGLLVGGWPDRGAAATRGGGAGCYKLDRITAAVVTGELRLVKAIGSAWR